VSEAKSALRFRKVVEEDLDACLDIYRANEARGLVPPHYEADFEADLTNGGTLFLTAILDGKIVACGGVFYGSPRLTEAYLCFGLVHPDHQRRKIGTRLLLARLSLLDSALAQPIRINLQATQYSKSYFIKIGFAYVTSEYGACGHLFEHYTLILSSSLLRSCQESLAASGTLVSPEPEAPTANEELSASQLVKGKLSMTRHFATAFSTDVNSGQLCASHAL
jgi:N-acetylglutamate synthase-like GNAT family acetyltransferase